MDEVRSIAEALDSVRTPGAPPFQIHGAIFHRILGSVTQFPSGLEQIGRNRTSI